MGASVFRVSEGWFLLACSAQSLKLWVLIKCQPFCRRYTKKSPLVDSLIPCCPFSFIKTKRKSSNPSSNHNVWRHSMTTPIVCFKNIAIHSIFCVIYFHNFPFFFSLTVTRLREQWDETSNCVMKRKSELVAMLGDSQRLLFTFRLFQGDVLARDKNIRNRLVY